MTTEAVSPWELGGELRKEQIAFCIMPAPGPMKKWQDGKISAKNLDLFLNTFRP